MLQQCSSARTQVTQDRDSTGTGTDHRESRTSPALQARRLVCRERTSPWRKNPSGATVRSTDHLNGTGVAANRRFSSAIRRWELALAGNNDTQGHPQESAEASRKPCRSSAMGCGGADRAPAWVGAGTRRSQIQKGPGLPKNTPRQRDAENPQQEYPVYRDRN
jgi:hypothetical protein